MLLSSQPRLMLPRLLRPNKLSRPRKPLMLLLETLPTPTRPTLLRRRLEPLETFNKVVINPTTHTQLSQDTTRTSTSQKRKCTSPSKPQLSHTKRRPIPLLLSSKPLPPNLRLWMTGKPNTPLPWSNGKRMPPSPIWSTIKRSRTFTNLIDRVSELLLRQSHKNL